MKIFYSKKTGRAFLILIVLLASSSWGLAQTQVAGNPVDLLDKASATFNRFMADQQMDWLHQNLKNAKGVLIVPELVKVGFFLGGAGGEAILFAQDEKTGEWSQPVFYSLGHVSFGLQLGGEKQEVLMLILTKKALAGLYKLNFKLGGDTSLAAGPIGGGFSGTVKADILSFSYSKGVFAGVAFEGAVMKVNSKANKVFYNKKVGIKDILVTKTISNPLADNLREALKKGSSQ